MMQHRAEMDGKGEDKDDKGENDWTMGEREWTKRSLKINSLVVDIFDSQRVSFYWTVSLPHTVTFPHGLPEELKQ